jgi:hypothetical protein
MIVVAAKPTLRWVRPLSADLDDLVRQTQDYDPGGSVHIAVRYADDSEKEYVILSNAADGELGVFEVEDGGIRPVGDDEFDEVLEAGRPGGDPS